MEQFRCSGDLDCKVFFTLLVCKVAKPAQLKYQAVSASYLKDLTPASLFTVLTPVQPLLVALMSDESRTLCADLSIQRWRRV